MYPRQKSDFISFENVIVIYSFLFSSVAAVINHSVWKTKLNSKQISYDDVHDLDSAQK